MIKKTIDYSWSEDKCRFFQPRNKETYTIQKDKKQIEFTEEELDDLFSVLYSWKNESVVKTGVEIVLPQVIQVGPEQPKQPEKPLAAHKKLYERNHSPIDPEAAKYLTGLE